MPDNRTPLKTLLLPAEIKTREFDSRILVGVLAAQKGWRVIFGSKSPLNRRVWKYDGDVYICQTLTKRRENNLQLFGNLGHVNVGWDEEGLIYYGRDIYLSRRVSEISVSLLDGLVSWGDVSKKDLEIQAKPYGVEVRSLGNPRMDILRPELRGLFKDEADIIASKYGNFILINTNFPYVNPHETVGAARKKAMRADKQASSEAGKRFLNLQAHRGRTLKAFFEVLPELAQKFPHTNIIIRPHPSESFARWHEVCAGHKNLIIAQEGSVIPWLMAAKALIHNGCTTAIEYFLLGHSPITFCPGGHNCDESPLPNGISHDAPSSADLFNLVQKSLEGRLKPAKAHKSLMDQFLSAQTGQMAAERVIDYCDELLHSRGGKNKNSWAYWRTYIYCALREVHRSMRFGDPSRKYTEKVFPKTDVAEVRNTAEKICEQLDLVVPVTIKERAKNIFEIRPAE